jgi:bacterioferritin-associated ferredoxin
MIVCICNRLNESKVRAALQSGARSADEVYARHGVERKCGSCHETIQAMLDDALQNAALLHAAE